MESRSKAIFHRHQGCTHQSSSSNKSYFTKDFLIFSFSSEHTVAGVLLQKNDQGAKQPIAFYSKVFRDAPLKYNIMEKHAYSLIKALKEFKSYILHSHTIAYVPSSAIKEILA